MQAYLLNVVQKECIDCKTGNGFAVVEFCSRVCVGGVEEGGKHNEI